MVPRRSRWIRSACLRLAALALCGGAVAAAGQAPSSRLAGHVVLVSIDGLPAGTRLRASGAARMPVLEAMASRGSSADGVVGQYPSLTYPSHTSIVTGVRPATHGIVHNTRFDPERGHPDWFFESDAIAVPALWDRAREAGLRVGAVSWPVTVGAPIDYLFPETHQSPRDTTWLDLARRQSTRGLVDAVVDRLGGFGPRDNLDYEKRDRFAAAAAVHILERHRPDLLLVHLVEADGAQHAHGPDSAAAVAALERVDARLGEIVAAAERAGIAGDTAWVVTGDHGFYRVHSAFQPNAVLREAGLLEADESGRITAWQAVAHRAGVVLRNPADEALARQVEMLFRALADGAYRGLVRVIDRSEIARLGGDPRVLLMLEPVEGYTVAAGVEGGFLVASSRRGDHGYLPTGEKMHTGLVLAGAGIRAGVPVPLARQIDIAPTVAQLLGVEMRGVEGVAMAGVLEPGRAPRGNVVERDRR